jgi:hypothetical protein
LRGHDGASWNGEWSIVVHTVVNVRWGMKWQGRELPKTFLQKLAHFLLRIGFLVLRKNEGTEGSVMSHNED